MPRQLFGVYFLLLLFVCCQLCGQKCAAQTQGPSGSANENSVVDFLKAEKNIIKAFNPNLKKVIDVTVKQIESVSLVAAGGVMVALAETDEAEAADRKINILAKYFKIKKNEELG